MLVRKRRLLQVAAATVALLTLGATGGQAADSLNPGSLTLTLAPGASFKSSQTLHLDATPPKADIVLAVDTTGSMGAAIANAKADAISIVGRIQSAIPGARFAVVDFKDYPISPFGGGGDYPYLLRSGLTSNASAVQTAVNAMSAGGGGDLPESFNRVFFETYSDPHLAYDPNAPRFLVVLGDDIPHDTGQNEFFSACSNTSVTDPGRDSTVGTSDDLETKATLDGLKDNNTNVSFVTYNPGGGTPGTPQCHAQMAAYTGGQQATHGATDSLADEIVALIEQAAARVDNVMLTVDEGFADWVSFDPTPPYGPFTTPRDVPYDMTVSVPPGTAPREEPYSFTVRAEADGAVRATQTVIVHVRELAASALTLTVDERSSPAGIAALPFSSIPASRIPFLGGTTSALPAGSIPAGSIPAGSIPAGSIPAGSIPAGSIPAGSIPAGSIPAGSIPAGSIPWGSFGLGSTPAGSIPAGSIALRQVLLSQIPLLNATTGATWQQVLAPPSALNLCPAGSPANRIPCRPLNALTLEDVANDPVALGRLNALPLKDVGVLTSSLWRGAPFAALLLGNAKLNQIDPPPGYASWATALDANGGSSAGVNTSTNTVFGVYVAGQLGSTPAGSIPAGSIPYGSIPAGSIPAGSIPAGSIELTMTRIGAVPILKLVPQPPKTLSAYVNCGGSFNCTGKTLGEADVAGRINPTLTLADLFAALPAGDPDRNAARQTTIDQLIMAMLPLTNYPWEEISVSGLQDVAQSTSQLHYHVDFDLDCSLATTFAITVNLPSDFMPVLGSTRYTYAGGAPAVGRNPTGNDGGDFVFTPEGTTPCGTETRHVRMDFTAFAGLTLGDHTADVSVEAGTQAQSINDRAPVLVTENHEANDAPLTSPVIARNTLVVGHVSHDSDGEHFRFPIGNLPRHSKVIAFLNVPEGADYDLVVNKPFSPALQSTPAGSIPAGSIPVEDFGASVDDSNRTLPPETLADVPAGSIPAGSIPAGSIPAGSISANRGSDSEAAQIVKAGETGDAIVSVSGFNGSHSAKPYVLRLQVVDPPPLPPCPRVTGLASATPGTLPAPGSLPADTKTLFLVNRQRLAGLYGAAAANGLLAPSPSAPLHVVAGRPEVKGALVPVDGNAQVRAAYATWDQNPCSVDAANEVVRRINSVITTYRAALPQLRYIVVLGTDQVIPMYRQDDLTSLSPEIDEAADLAFTTNNLTAGNALYAAAAQNTVPTDGAYGAFTKITWLGHDLPLAQTPVSRLVETPAHMTGQFEQYIAANGLLDPKSAVTMGYDFLTDGANDINGALAAQFPGITNDTLISPTGAPGQWQKSDFLAASFNKTNGGAPAVPDIISPNAHYSHWLAQPAGPSPITSFGQMVSTADVPGSNAIAGKIVFNMGCHGGLNVPDLLFGDAARKKDWVDSYLQAKNAVYIANTGFGYGDTVTVALTERLLKLFGQKLNSNDTSIGEQWIEALQTYYLTAGDYDVFDEKAMIEATFYGLPFYHFRVPGNTPAPTPPETTLEDGLDKASLPVLTPSPTEHPVSGGRKYWEIGRNTLNVPYRPVTPLLATEVTVPGKSARGVFIRSLTTHDVPNVRPLLAYPRIDSELKEPHPTFANTYWPANFVSLLRTRSLGVERASVVVKAGQFRPNTAGNPDLGTERLVDSIGLDVFYSSSTDTTTPRIEQVGGVIDSGGTTFFVRTTDAAGVNKVAILYNTGTQADWQFRPLQNVSGDLWTFRENGLTAPTSILAEARDVNGNTGFGANKGVNHTSFTDPAQGPSIFVGQPVAGAVFTLNQQVTPDFSCSDAGAVASCTGAPLVNGKLDTTTPGTHEFTVTAIDLAGNTSTKTVTYFVSLPETVFFFHGTGATANPPTLTLDFAAPSATTAKYKDSSGISFSGGNPWKEVGTWNAAQAGSDQTLVDLGALHAFLGLQNSDDQGTQFDLRAQLFKNGVNGVEHIGTATELCITGVTRNPDLAKAITADFGPSDATVAPGEFLSITLSTRIGTNSDGSKCPGPGGSHSNAVGLRVYFDAGNRPTRFGATFAP